MRGAFIVLWFLFSRVVNSSDQQVSEVVILCCYFIYHIHPSILKKYKNNYEIHKNTYRLTFTGAEDSYRLKVLEFLFTRIHDLTTSMCRCLLQIWLLSTKVTARDVPTC